MIRKSLPVIAAIAIVGLLAAAASACPFCGAVQSTLSQDIKNSDVAVIARLVALPVRAPVKEGELDVSTPMATLEVVEVLKGKETLGTLTRIQAPFFDDKPLGGEYLVQGAQPPALIWGPPIALTPHSHQYLIDLIKLPENSPERLVFLIDYLGDREELLSRDSYDEFALAPYAALKAIKDKMPHDKIVKRIEDLETTPSHRRLYLTMLGVCGGPQDLPMLEKLLRSKEPKLKAGLDATVACYLVLRGEAGLPLIEDLFLKKDTDEFTDIFSVVMALRVLGQEKGVIPQDKIVSTMRLVLDHPRVADQAIMDLARWQDWTVIDRLVELFKSKDQDVVSFVRVPVINYLRACPLPQAKQYIEELRKLDPKSVQQSETLYNIDVAGSDPSGQPPAAATRATATQAGVIGDGTTPKLSPEKGAAIEAAPAPKPRSENKPEAPVKTAAAVESNPHPESEGAKNAKSEDDSARRTWGLAGGVLLIVIGLGAMIVSATRKGRTPASPVSKT
jgi:hypothetical protein